MAEHVVRSPLPGVFFRRPAPDEAPFAEVGSHVTADQTIGLVEIMKQFTEVRAGVEGTVVAFSADNDQVLNPGESIATIEVD